MHTEMSLRPLDAGTLISLDSPAPIDLRSPVLDCLCLQRVHAGRQLPRAGLSLVTLTANNLITMVGHHRLTSRPLAPIAHFVSESFAALADPARARSMAAYMKTDQPFHGIPRPIRSPVYREMKRRFAPGAQHEYLEGVAALWGLPCREDKYAAIHYAMAWPRFLSPALIPFFRRMITEGAWWDLVDDIAVKLVGRIWLDHRDETSRVMDRWIEDRNMWIRRTALIGQLSHKKQTDESRLFGYCLNCAHEKQFFIRKAIGWALRQHSYSHPAAVRRFLLTHRTLLSGLSFREGARALLRKGDLSLG